MKSLNCFKKSALGLTLISAALIFTSCAKSPSARRTIRQTNQNVINPAVSDNSVRAAVNQNLFYEITSLSRPTENVQVEIQLKTPNGMDLPITTDHATQRDAYGIYDDPQSGAKLEIRARCDDAECSKYTLLITVIKNSYAYHQMAAVSYKDDCAFNLEQLNAMVTQSFYTSLNAIDSKFQTYGVAPRNDCQFQ